VRSFGAYGPIFSYTDWEGGDRNLLIEQQGDDLVVIFRIRDIPARDHRTHVVPAVFATSEWHDVELVVEEGKESLSVNGRKILANRLPEKALSSWKTGPDFLVSLANVLSGTRPWLGEIAACVVQAGEVRVDYLDPAATKIKPTFWVNLKFNLTPSLQLTWDNAANFVCFLPLGFVVACLGGVRVRSSPPPCSARASVAASSWPSLGSSIICPPSRTG
jgi:hypothetical protein